MNNEIKDILQMLNQGKIDSRCAIKLINEFNPDKTSIIKKSSKIKVIVFDKEDDKKIKIPAIPFWLLTTLGNLGLKVSSFALKNSKEVDEESRKVLEVLKDMDLKEIFEVLKNHPPCDIVNITDGEDGDEVIISIL